MARSTILLTDGDQPRSYARAQRAEKPTLLLPDGGHPGSSVARSPTTTIVLCDEDLADRAARRTTEVLEDTQRIEVTAIAFRPPRRVQHLFVGLAPREPFRGPMAWAGQAVRTCPTRGGWRCLLGTKLAALMLGVLATACAAVSVCAWLCADLDTIDAPTNSTR